MRKSSLPLHFQGLNENTSTVPRVSTSLRARKGFVLGHSSLSHHRRLWKHLFKPLRITFDA